MVTAGNPAIQAFARSIDAELQFAQILISREGAGFELRHVGDLGRRAEELDGVLEGELTEVAKFTGAGEYRPLKSAPDLRSGWRCEIRGEEELERALERLYPGAVADWFASREGRAEAADYREFTGRQTGMYRLTAKLEEGEVADTVAAVCDARSCLKRRLWTAPGSGPDEECEKSMIVCLEPCALLLEFARTVKRMEQEGDCRPQLTRGDLQTVRASLERSLRSSETTVRSADFSSPENSRRVRLALRRIERALEKAEEEGD